MDAFRLAIAASRSRLTSYMWVSEYGARGTSVVLVSTEGVGVGFGGAWSTDGAGLDEDDMATLVMAT
jgi:hypothetical protein